MWRYSALSGGISVESVINCAMRFERLAADKIAGDVSVRRKTLRTGNRRNNKGVDGKRDRVPVRSLPSLRNDGSETWEGAERPVCIRILSCRASYSFVRM